MKICTKCLIEKVLRYHKQYNKKNRVTLCEQKRRYYQDNRRAIIEEKAQYIKGRLKIDVQFKLTCKLRTRLFNALKNNFKSGSAVRDLGCSIEFLKKYLEAQFRDGMSWENYGKWHIDHIGPLSSFDLTKREELLKACHYTNLQPLWKHENLAKGAKQ